MIEGHELGSVGMRPDWVILGTTIPEHAWPDEWAQGWRYMAVGSSEVSQADLSNEMVFDRGDPFHRPPPWGSATRTVLRCRLGSYTLAFGRTYAEALARLMGAWSPEQTAPAPQALPGGKGELKS